MATYVGEALTVVAQATDPVRQTPVVDANAVVDFYAAGANPAKNAGDRNAEHGPFPMAYDDTVVNADGTKGAYVGVVDTTGWAAGKRYFKVTLSGSYDSWEYSTVNLSA